MCGIEEKVPPAMWLGLPLAPLLTLDAVLLYRVPVHVIIHSQSHVDPATPPPGKQLRAAARPLST